MISAVSKYAIWPTTMIYEAGTLPTILPTAKAESNPVTRMGANHAAI